MPGTKRRRLSVLVIAGVVGLMPAGCKSNPPAPANQGAVAPSAVDQQARDDIKKINDYLGNVPPNGETEKTLLRTLNINNDKLRTIIRDMRCDIWKLQHPTGGQCPGGGSTAPTNVPKYPA
jgi:hypothetical protein